MSNIITIPITKGLFVTINSEDYELVLPYSWYAKKGKNTYYAANKNKSVIYMHRLILGLTDPNLKGDHIDHNGLNNCRNNLRVATNSQNNFNAVKRRGHASTKYKGIYYDRSREKWACEIKVNKKKKYIGRFKSEVKAALAYNEAALKYYGEFAHLNDITPTISFPVEETPHSL
jgi:hypothetical protein